MKSSLSHGKSFWGFKYAFKGIWRTIREERHFRFHICAAVGTGMFTEYFNLNATQYLFFGLAVALVLSAELINTAVEHTVDLCVQSYNPKAEAAKDASAAFVLVCAFFALFVAAMLFLGKGILIESLIDIFTRPKYIIYFILAAVFMFGDIKEKRNGKNI